MDIVLHITFRLSNPVIMYESDEDVSGNDAQSVHGSDSQAGHYTDSDPDDEQDEQADLGDPGTPDRGSGDQDPPGHRGAVSLRQPCRDHDTDYEDSCSECQDLQQIDHDYEDQPAKAVVPPASDADVDKIPSLLERHARTDQKKETLVLEPEVVALATQRLGEGQYESNAKFAKLVDKVHQYFYLF